ncbi:putative chromosome transmission fidelity protein 18 [Triangularia verruculosa]|uniref:Chromosome transmission fidelity protein 18 n=1 Tax=Triangularia verruculosa TaxID=2587418 RepID=A0AAN7ARB6_9PEZI|nr:putative chromosome transmission fidelity protein 18 [Triangularia verruculosa]
MIAPSSPIIFPASSSPIKAKRPRPAEPPKQLKPRVLAGFLADDDSDDGDGDDDETTRQPSPKRRMLDPDTQNAEQLTGNTGTETQETISTPPESQPPQETEEEAERYDRLFGTQATSILPSQLSQPLPDFLRDEEFAPAPYGMSTCSGKTIPIRERKPAESISYATMVAARSRTKEGRAKKSYFGIDIHSLMDKASQELAKPRKKTTAPIAPPVHPDEPLLSVEPQAQPKKQRRTLLWTEKYRARNFMDLVGDDLTNRQVLRWLKKWDPIVFPNSAKSRPSVRRQQQQQAQDEEERPHRKILMLHGPPGLGKTTLAHVCARQAGYDVLEINASDDRSKDVVKGRIRTTLGTETVKTLENKKAGEAGKRDRIARPICVVVDEVDGVVSGSGAGGEGGFVKALIDLVMVDQKNSSGQGSTGGRKKKGDDFRQMRPLILICNDVYHPSLRPLRQSGLAEVIHVGKPTVEAVVTRLKAVFEKEGIPCDKDAARKLCEAAWGMTSGQDARKGAESTAEGDLRGVMVVGEWVAGRLKATSKQATPCLTRQWIDQNVIQDLAHGGGGARGLGRGGVREIVNRIFQEGAGFPKQNLSTAAASKNALHEQPQAQLGFSEQIKKYAMARLREMIDTSGEVDRIMTEIFLEYPNRDFNDDSFLTKPDMAYEWMHFHDTCSSRIFSAQEWELAQYISQPVLACHHLFASARRHQPAAQEKRWGEDDPNEAPPLPFSGPRADYEAREAEKLNRAILQGIQDSLPPSLSRSFRSPEDVATDFLPYLVRLISPDVKPVVVGGSDKMGSIASVRREGEKAMVRRAANVLAEVGIQLHKGKIEDGGLVGRTTWVYRMEPDLDTLATFETASSSQFLFSQAPPTRYAVRQVLDQELAKTIAAKETASRQARLRAGGGVVPQHDDNKENVPGHLQKLEMLKQQERTAVKKDFFGRIIVAKPALGETSGNAAAGNRIRGPGEGDKKVWITYNEGINNAVRKPISLEEFLRGF